MTRTGVSGLSRNGRHRPQTAQIPTSARESARNPEPAHAARPARPIRPVGSPAPRLPVLLHHGHRHRSRRCGIRSLRLAGRPGGLWPPDAGLGSTVWAGSLCRAQTATQLVTPGHSPLGQHLPSRQNNGMKPNESNADRVVRLVIASVMLVVAIATAGTVRSGRLSWAARGRPQQGASSSRKRNFRMAVSAAKSRPDRSRTVCHPPAGLDRLVL